MGKNNCFRHFKALMRKNFILWFRTPGCSIFEILAPVILMVALTLIRMQIPTASVDQEGMFKKKYIVYPGVPMKGLGTWYTNTKNVDELSARVVGLACYSDYFDKHDPDDCRAYDTALDWKGPQFFAPSQCLKTYSWNKPKIASPLIGIIGTQGDLTDSYSAYYIALRKI